MTIVFVFFQGRSKTSEFWKTQPRTNIDQRSVEKRFSTPRNQRFCLSWYPKTPKRFHCFENKSPVFSDWKSQGNFSPIQSFQICFQKRGGLQQNFWSTESSLADWNRFETLKKISKSNFVRFYTQNVFFFEKMSDWNK